MTLHAPHSLSDCSLRKTLVLNITTLITVPQHQLFGAWISILLLLLIHFSVFLDVLVFTQFYFSVTSLSVQPTHKKKKGQSRSVQKCFRTTGFNTDFLHWTTRCGAKDSAWEQHPVNSWCGRVIVKSSLWWATDASQRPCCHFLFPVDHTGNPPPSSIPLHHRPSVIPLQ